MSTTLPPALDWTEAVEVEFFSCSLLTVALPVDKRLLEPLDFVPKLVVKELAWLDSPACEDEGSHHIVDVYLTPFAEDVIVVRGPSVEVAEAVDLGLLEVCPSDCRVLRDCSSDMIPVLEPCSCDLVAELRGLSLDVESVL